MIIGMLQTIILADSKEYIPKFIFFGAWALLYLVLALSCNKASLKHSKGILQINTTWSKVRSGRKETSKAVDY